MLRSTESTARRSPNTRSGPGSRSPARHERPRERAPRSVGAQPASPPRRPGPRRSRHDASRGTPTSAAARRAPRDTSSSTPASASTASTRSTSRSSRSSSASRSAGAAQDSTQPLLGHQDREERVAADGVQGAVDRDVDAAAGLEPGRPPRSRPASRSRRRRAGRAAALLAVEEPVKRALGDPGRPRQFVDGGPAAPGARRCPARLRQAVADPVSLLSGKGPGHLSRL